MHAVTIIGDGGEGCSKEVLDSHKVTRVFVPQLSPIRFDSRGDKDHPADKQHPPKVSAWWYSSESISL